MKWPLQMEQTLIEAVKSHPLLWNRRLTLFRSKSARRRAYYEVCETLSEVFPEATWLKPEYIQKKWREIRLSEKKYNYNVAKGNGKMANWEHSNALDFLRCDGDESCAGGNGDDTASDIDKEAEEPLIDFNEPHMNPIYPNIIDELNIANPLAGTTATAPIDPLDPDAAYGAYIGGIFRHLSIEHKFLLRTKIEQAIFDIFKLKHRESQMEHASPVAASVPALVVPTPQ